MAIYNNIQPDISIIDYKLPSMDGIHVAIEILTEYPTAAILFINAYADLEKEISKYKIFEHKRIKLLLKLVKLIEIETAIVNLLWPINV
jgi:CheY-like chemotaxis protein